MMVRPGKLSVIVPVYQCAGCLRELHRRLTQCLGSLELEYELVLVDDRSHDESWSVLRELAAADSRVSVFRLARNFGQAAAIGAGMSRATGDWILLMDCDLQDRPEDIELLLKAAWGNDIVFTRRLNRHQTLFRRLTAKVYFRFRNAVLGIDAEREIGSLVLLSRKVATAYERLPERDREHVLLLWWLGFDRATVDVEHGPRYAGRSAYTFKKLVGVGLQGVFFQSSKVLQWIVYVGIAVATGGFIFAIVAFVDYFASSRAIAGWTSVVVIELVLGGVILMSVGISALYIGRIFEQTKERPLYIVDEEVVAGERPEVEAAARLV